MLKCVQNIQTNTDITILKSRSTSYCSHWYYSTVYYFINTRKWTTWQHDSILRHSGLYGGGESAGRYTCTLDVHYRYTRVWSLIGFRLGLHTSPLMTLDTYVSIPYIVLPGLESKWGEEPITRNVQEVRGRCQGTDHISCVVYGRTMSWCAVLSMRGGCRIATEEHLQWSVVAVICSLGIGRMVKAVME